jgi:hypothetical protein
MPGLAGTSRATPRQTVRRLEPPVHDWRPRPIGATQESQIHEGATGPVETELDPDYDHSVSEGDLSQTPDITGLRCHQNGFDQP